MNYTTSLSKFLVFTLTLIILSGCAATGGEQHTDAQGEDAATINSTSTRYGFQKWTLFSVYSVNGKIVPLGLVSDPKKTKVAPGKSAIVIRARYNDGGSGPFITRVPMEVELLPGTIYEIRGIVHGATVETWLVLASTHEKASSSFSASERTSLASPVIIKIPLK